MSTQHLGEEYLILTQYCLHDNSLAVSSAGHFTVLSDQQLLRSIGVHRPSLEPTML